MSQKAPEEVLGNLTGKKKRKFKKSPLVRKLNQMTDKRRGQGKRHSQGTVLAIAASAYATRAGVEGGYAGAGKWASELPQIALRRLGCRNINGRYVPPSAATIRRVLQEVDPVEFQQLVCKHLGISKAVGVVAVDGKTLRGSKRQDAKAKAVLSAYDTNTGMVLRQREISEEHLEIPEFVPLLAPLDLVGAIVTADAMHTQVAHARFLVEQKKADFLFIVKGNQSRLFGELNRWSESRFSDPVTTIDKGHGRIELRAVQVAQTEGRYLPFPHVKQVVRIVRTVTDLTGKELRGEICFAITSLPQDKADGGRLLEISRKHWAIENKLHHVKDRTMREDASSTRVGAIALSQLRSTVLGLLRLSGYTNIAAALRELSGNWRKALALVGA